MLYTLQKAQHTNNLEKSTKILKHANLRLFKSAWQVTSGHHNMAYRERCICAYQISEEFSGLVLNPLTFPQGLSFFEQYSLLSVVKPDRCCKSFGWDSHAPPPPSLTPTPPPPLSPPTIAGTPPAASSA